MTDILVYLAAFDLGLGPIFWLLISEIYPTTVRAQSMALAKMAIRAGDFMVTVTFLTVVEHLGMRGCFLLFAGLCAAAFVFSLRLVPETRGRTLEEIESSWNRREVGFASRRWPTTNPRVQQPEDRLCLSQRPELKLRNTAWHVTGG